MTDYELDDRNSISGSGKQVLRALYLESEWSVHTTGRPRGQEESAGFEVAPSSEGPARDFTSIDSSSKDKNDSKYSLCLCTFIRSVMKRCSAFMSSKIPDK